MCSDVTTRSKYWWAKWVIHLYRLAYFSTQRPFKAPKTNTRTYVDKRQTNRSVHRYWGRLNTHGDAYVLWCSLAGGIHLTDGWVMRPIQAYNKKQSNKPIVTSNCLGIALRAINPLLCNIFALILFSNLQFLQRDFTGVLAWPHYACGTNVHSQQEKHNTKYQQTSLKKQQPVWIC